MASLLQSKVFSCSAERNKLSKNIRLEKALKNSLNLFSEWNRSNSKIRYAYLFLKAESSFLAVVVGLVVWLGGDRVRERDRDERGDMDDFLLFNSLALKSAWALALRLSLSANWAAFFSAYIRLSACSCSWWSSAPKLVINKTLFLETGERDRVRLRLDAWRDRERDWERELERFNHC